MSPVRVLYVDDNPDYAELVTQYLTRERDAFEVVAVTDTSAGLNRLDDEAFDCVVSDYQMPGRDGLEFFADLRETHPNVPFILFTSKGSEEIASEAISVGVTDYLQKDGGSEQYALLANRVENAVERARSKRRAAKQRRINDVVSRVNRALVRESSRRELEARVCEIFSESEPYLFAWVGGVDPDTRHIRPREWAGIEEGYLDSVTVTADERPTGQGPAGVAVKERRVAVAQRVGEDADFSPWREAALERGYRATAAAPLEYDDEFYGVLAVYADRPDAFDEDERRLLGEVADDIAHAIDGVETRADLRRERQFVSQTLDALEEAFYVVGPDGRLERWNDGLRELTGYGDEELDGTPAIEFFAPADRDAVAEAIDEVLETGQARVTAAVLTDDGTRVPLELTGARLVGTDGELLGLAGIGRDVTDQRRREAELQRQRDRFERLFEHASDAIAYCVFEEEGPIITDVNPAFERTFGYDAEAAVGENLDELVVPAERIETARRISRRTQAGEHVTTELVREAVDGWRRFRHQSIPLDVEGETHQYAIYTDVTSDLPV
jgi:PAS domain S-box-containing protein